MSLAWKKQVDANLFAAAAIARETNIEMKMMMRDCVTIRK
jgi:hypothetical protein